MSGNDYANPDLVWSPDRLKDRIGGRKGDDLILIDTRPAPNWSGGHIEGSAQLDIYGISLNDTGPEALAAFTWMLAYPDFARRAGFGFSSISATKTFMSSTGGWRPGGTRGIR